MRKLVVGAFAAAAFAVVGSGSAQAAYQPYDPMPVDPGIGGSAEGLVFIEVERGEGVANSAMLICPDGSGHGKGVEACAQLTVAEGDFSALLPVTDALCTKEYDPVTFRAVGFWDGGLVVFEREYSNYCIGVNATGGAVFDIGKP